MYERLHEINKYYEHDCNIKLITRIIRIMQYIYHITDSYSDIKNNNNMYYNHIYMYIHPHKHTHIHIHTTKIHTKERNNYTCIS